MSSYACEEAQLVGCLGEVPLMGGELDICLFANKPRIGASACMALRWKPEASYKRRFYSAEDMGESENRAYEEWRKFKTL